ncbi:MAG: ribosomal protein S18-alanine N-acetyltransferase [Gammaproteobacteria bacterium]|nr:ribosomal protein S18-alanine N-acetyltransferase [Gammaproteobacteria bacterium]
MSAVLQPQFVLRPMLSTDLEAIVLIEESSYDFPWSYGIFRDCLQVGYSCWVYEVNHRVIAYGVMSQGAGEAHILTLVVREDYRGQGIGRLLLSHLLTLAGQCEVDTVLLEVRPSNHVAISLYQSMGFNEVGVRLNYYPALRGRENAMIMALALIK